jgi:Lon protease-like protein
VHPLALTLALLATLSQHSAPDVVGRRRPDVSRVAVESQAAKPITLPSEIPLFPLPEVVLFPGVQRPLLIYEPRYREMVADALKGNRIIGTVLLRPGFEASYEGRPPIYGIGCAGVIEDYEQMPDGRYAILLRGLTTFRVVSEDQRKPYRLARVEAIPESLGDEERGPLRMLRERLARLLDAALPLDVKPPDPSLEDDEFVNVTAQAFDMPEAARQDLLERNSVLARARALVERLAK